MTTHTITIGDDLPFHAQAFTTPGDALCIRVRCRPGTPTRGLLQIQTHVAIFIEAALHGMGAGARVPPRLDHRSIDDLLQASTRDLHHPEVEVRAPVIVDPRDVAVLLHQLLGLADYVAIEDVTVDLPCSSPTRERIAIVRGHGSVLPEAPTPLPFAFEDDRSGHCAGCTVGLTYAERPGEPELARLREGLRVFLAQALLGGFIPPPMGPSDAFVGADDEVTVHGEQVTWVLERCDLPPGALLRVLGWLTAYHHQVAALREVVFE